MNVPSTLELTLSGVLEQQNTKKKQSIAKNLESPAELNLNFVS